MTINEHSAVIFSYVSSGLSADGLLSSALSKAIDQLYREGEISDEKIIDALDQYYAEKYCQPNEEEAAQAVKRAAIVADINANLAVDGLRPSAFSKKLDELYIAGMVTTEQSLHFLNNHFKNRCR